MKTEQATTIRVSKDVKRVLKRFCKIHGWSMVEFQSRLAQLLVNGLDMLDNPNIRIETLREYYDNSELFVVADSRQLFKNNNEGAPT